jgi:hypothetical protein
MNDDQRKHLEMLQAVIARLAGNSFSIKGWAVALVAVLGGFAAKDSDPRFVFGLWLPVLCFWGLDAFYLRQERLYRALYNSAIRDGSNVPIYTMNTEPFQKEVPGALRIALSRTVLWLHFPILIFVLVLSTYSIYRVGAAHYQTPHPPQLHRSPLSTSPSQRDLPTNPALLKTRLLSGRGAYRLEPTRCSSVQQLEAWGKAKGWTYCQAQRTCRRMTRPCHLADAHANLARKI